MFGSLFFTFFIFISLQVTQEIVKFIKVYYMNWEEVMH